MHLHLGFHTILFLAYSIPGTYVFFRILYLFIPRESRLWYVLIYFLFAAIWPVSNAMHDGAPASEVLSEIADYLLPFYLYVFLSVLLFDILLLINRIFRIISLQKLKIPEVRRWCLVSILLLSATIVTGGIINFKTIRTSLYNIEIPGRSSSLRHLKIAFASDLHLQERTDPKFVRRFVEKIEEIKPDLMIFGGDILEGDGSVLQTRQFIQMLSNIHPKYGVYTVPGNHEYYAGQDDGSFFARAGMKVLYDSYLVIDSLFTLAGRCDSHFAGRISVQDLLVTAPSYLPLILVDHRPTELDQVVKTKADIQLSGHTHNGQLFPINLITGKVYELSWGHMKKGNTHFFVSSGVSLWGPHVRTTGKSEIMVIDVTFIDN
jgi:uncharacterized protein